MKTYKILYVGAIVFAFITTSCQKVIDIDLNSVSPQVVIEGTVYDQPGPYTVKIAQTVNFDEPNIYPPVTGALVIIADNAGNCDTLIELVPGEYRTSTLRGVVGRTYTLTVITNGKTYSAISRMPQAVQINNLNFGKNSYHKTLTVSFTDPAVTDNYYRVVEHINGTRQTGFDVVDDALNPGGLNTYDVISERNDSLKSGDNVMIWLESVDKDVYEYLRISGSGDGKAAPANPPSNINNGALGYFSACSFSTKSIVHP